MTIPYIIEQGPNNQERVYDLYSRLLKDRIIFIRGIIEEGFSDSIIGQLLFLEADSNEKDIYMYINSNGGLVSETYAIYDVMRYIKPDIVTIGYGSCASGASFLLAAGAKNKRYALPSVNVMIHELSAGNTGRFNDMKNYQKHLDTVYERMAKDYSDFTGQKISRIKRDMERDFYMTAEEAKNYGLIDKIQYVRE